MNVKHRMAFLAMVGLLTCGSAWWVARAAAHCDTEKGPLIPEARAALERGNVTPVLKWIPADDEVEIKTAFSNAQAVRAKGPEARDLADRYFLETLVRVHRAGEGAPFTGISDAAPDPAAVMADEALESGSPDMMIAAISAHMEKAIREKFDRAVETRKHKDESVAAGREFVEAYVAYVHHVEGVHAAIVSAGAHAHAEADAAHAGH